MSDPIERFFEPIAQRLEKLLSGFAPWQGFALVALCILIVLIYGSISSGWFKLAQRYPLEHRFDGEWIRMPDFFGNEGARFALDFNNQEQESVDLGVDSQGLYLSMSLPFRIFHAPIFVPWSDVTSVAWPGIPWSDKKTDVRFTFARCPDVPLAVGLDVAREMEKRTAGRWSVPSGLD